MTTIRIGLVQLSSEGDTTKNLNKSQKEVLRAIEKGAKIICLQELYKADYFCRDYNQDHFKLAEPLDGESFQTFSEIAKQHQVVIIVPIFEKRAEGIYHNSVIVINADGQLSGYYRKLHIPDDPNFYEKYYFTPGDRGVQVFDTAYGRIGVLICWDQWFPEAARMAALKGAQILFYPTAIGKQDSEDPKVAESQHQGWEIVQRGHAVANEIFVASVNRVGKEGPITFWGQSFVSDPFGGIISKASIDQEEILIADCDLDEIEQTRQGWPFFRDRRVDAYQGILEKYIGNETKPEHEPENTSA